VTRPIGQQTQEFLFQDWVPFPLERVFLFFASPGNLPRIMPPWTRTRVDAVRLLPPPPAPDGSRFPLDSLAGVGSEIVTSFRTFPFLPVRSQWIAQITEFEWNHHFEDVQAKGPFRSWLHRHETQAETRKGVAGTLVRDRIQLEVGFGVLGKSASRFFLPRQIARTFEHRQRTLPALLREDR
jgi:ligand-binding SRPBCC domain-containing protein